MTLEDPQLDARVTELRQKVARAAAVDFEKQALHEEKHQRWDAAAKAWLRVAEGRPKDSVPLQRAALAQLQAQVPSRVVIETAKRAVELAPTDAQAHRTLAKVYMAADMQASAHTELEAAERCSSSGPVRSSDTKPPGLWQRLLGRDDPD
jgi:DNA-binding SARP family transcriptional activator